jgi:hypothetical protein
MYHYAQATKIQMQAMKEHVQVGLGYDCDEAKTDIHESNSHKRCTPKPLPQLSYLKAPGVDIALSPQHNCVALGHSHSDQALALRAPKGRWRAQVSSPA